MHSEVVSWNLPHDNEAHTYSVNHVIHAYTKGINDGMEKNEKLFLKQLDDNKKTAGNDTTKVIEYLKSRGINPISAHLRIESVYALDVLITVSDEDFLKDSFSENYTFVNHLQQIGKTDFYSITFNFINQSKEFNKELLSSDGYFLSFSPLEKSK